MSGESQSYKEKGEKMKQNETGPKAVVLPLGNNFSVEIETLQYSSKPCGMHVLCNSEENSSEVSAEGVKSSLVINGKEEVFSGNSKDLPPALNDFVSKTKVQQKRQRQASSCEENSSSHRKTFSPGSYRTNKKWRKLQQGPLGEHCLGTLTCNGKDADDTVHMTDLHKMNFSTKVKGTGDTELEPTVSEPSNKYQAQISDVRSCSANSEVQETPLQSQASSKGLEITNPSVKVEAIDTVTNELCCSSSGDTRQIDNSTLEHLENNIDDVNAKRKKSLCVGNTIQKQESDVTSASQIASRDIQVTCLPSSRAKGFVMNKYRTELMVPNPSLPFDHQKDQRVFCPSTFSCQSYASQSFNCLGFPGFPINNHQSALLWNTHKYFPSYLWSFINHLRATSLPRFKQSSMFTPEAFASSFGSHLSLRRPEFQSYPMDNNQNMSNMDRLDPRLLDPFFCPEMPKTTRRWEQVQRGPSGSSGSGMGVSVMSYNILSQILLERHPDLYSQCHRRDLVWPHRGAAILREIISHSPDIVCLQEVQADHWKHDIQPVLKSHGYHGFYKKKSGDQIDGCAILYKKWKFTQVKVVPVQFCQGEILDRDNVGLILLLRPSPRACRGRTKTICVATTHLLFNPKRGDVKLAQLMMFLAEIDKVAAQTRRYEEGHATLKNQFSHCSMEDGKRGPPHHSKAKLCSQNKGHVSPHQSEEDTSSHAAASCSTESHAWDGSAAQDNSRPQRYCPIILCGDFNSEPFCDLYQLIVTGQLKYEGLVSRLICGQSEGRERGADVYLGQHLLPSHLGVTESCQYVHTLTERHMSAQRAKSKPRRWDQQPGDHFKTKASSKDIQKNKLQLENSNSTLADCSTNIGSQLVQKSFPNEKHQPEQCGAASERWCRDREQQKCGTPESQTKQEDVPFSPPQTNSGRAYHSVNFKSVYPHFTEARGRGRGRIMEISSQHDRCSCTVDYIFYTPCSGNSGKEEQGEVQLELLSRYSLLTSEEIACTGPLPNATLPSDHLCLIAQFLLH